MCGRVGDRRVAVVAAAASSWRSSRCRNSAPTCGVTAARFCWDVRRPPQPVGRDVHGRRPGAPEPNWSLKVDVPGIGGPGAAWLLVGGVLDPTPGSCRKPCAEPPTSFLKQNQRRPQWTLRRIAGTAVADRCPEIGYCRGCGNSLSARPEVIASKPKTDRPQRWDQFVAETRTERPTCGARRRPEQRACGVCSAEFGSDEQSESGPEWPLDDDGAALILTKRWCL